MAITVHNKISESATTTVYRAYDGTLQREVLLKVLHRHLAHDPQVRLRFEREARACAALHSDNIVQVFDLRTHEGSPAIVMEFVDGPSLKEMIEEGKGRTAAFAEKVAVDVLSGLAIAHARGITHRDIKPGNILVSSSGTVKITDFGLAQIAVSPTVTTEGMVVGTPAYFSPEVVRGERADVRSDLFSLGATLVEVLTGERLFDGKAYSECLNRITMFTTDSLDRLAVATSAEFVAFLKRLMDPDPGKRFESPQKALEALRGRPSDRSAGQPLPRRKLWLKAGVPLLTVVLALVTYVLVRGRPESPAETSSVPAIGSGDSSVLAEPGSASLNSSGEPRRDLSATVRSERPQSNQNAGPDPGREPGSLRVSGSRGAQVRIDDQLVGELPLAQPVAISPGTHTVLFLLEPFEPIVQTVNVAPGEEIKVTGDFVEKTGFLRCIVNPWAEISVDDRYRQTTPSDRPIAVTAGTHRVRFHHPSFRDSLCNLSVAPAETLVVNLTFTP